MARLFVPDLAFAAAVLTLFYALVLFDAPSRLFRDSDTGWHIRAGESMLSTGTLPRVDPYSWTKPGEPWVAWEWGADVVMGSVHRAAGLSGVALLYLAAIALCSWLWFRLQWAAGGDFLLACAMASPMLSTVNMHWLARPHIFGWAMLLVWFVYAAPPKSRFRPLDGAAVFALTVLWTNVHASFFLLPVTAVLFAVGRDRVWFLSAAAISAVASLINPYGYRLHQHLADYLANQQLLARVGEFQTFNFHVEGAWQILIAVGLGAAGAALCFEQRRFGEGLVLALLFAIGLRSARGLPVLALALPFANAAITRALRSSADSRIHRALAYTANLRKLELPFAGYAWAPVVLALAFVILRAPAVQARTGFPASEFPVAASSALATLPPEARLFAPDKFGGYLIYRFRGERKVFFDGRSDFYGTAFMDRYIDMVQLRPGWRDSWSEFGFTHALLPVRYSLAGELPRMGWREKYRDQTAALFEAPAGLNERVEGNR